MSRCLLCFAAVAAAAAAACVRKSNDLGSMSVAPTADPRFDEAWRKLAAQNDDDEVFYIEDDHGEGLMGRVRRTRKASAPAVAPPVVPPPAAPSAETASPEEISSVVRSNLPQVKVCYLRLSRESGRSISGRAIVSMKIDKDGQVAEVEVDAPAFRDTPLPGCVTQQVKRWSFPKSASGLALSYPFVFVGG